MNGGETWARECDGKSNDKEGARRRLNAFLGLAKTSLETLWFNGFLRINSSNIVTVFASSSPTPFIDDRQTDHTWSLLLFRSLRRCPAQLSIITTSYSTFIGQAVERCNFLGNVSVSCSVSSCCLDFQIQILAMDQRHCAFHDTCSKVEATSQSHVTRPSPSWHPYQRNLLVEVGASG